MRNIPVYYDMLWHENFPLECESLSETCMRLASSDMTGGVRVSNAGGYQSYHGIQTMPEFYNLVRIIEIQFKQLSEEFELVDQVEPMILDMWFNINPPGAHNRLHRHVNPPSLDRIASASIWSGTFYVSVPTNSGDLVFHNGREDYTFMTHEPAIVRIPEMFMKNANNKHIRPLYRVKPKNGDMFFWMSDMIHGVEQNRSEEVRISISFNLGLKFKEPQ